MSIKAHVGVFSADKNYLDEYFKAILSETLEAQVNARTRVINTPSIVYSFHLVNCKEHIYKFNSMQFSNVLLHKSLSPEYIPFILSRLR